jgi:hypothetical protein
MARVGWSKMVASLGVMAKAPAAGAATSILCEENMSAMIGSAERDATSLVAAFRGGEKSAGAARRHGQLTAFSGIMR